jgi:hypothetical protein
MCADVLSNSSEDSTIFSLLRAFACTQLAKASQIGSDVFGVLVCKKRAKFTPLLNPGICAYLPLSRVVPGRFGG